MVSKEFKRAAALGTATAYGTHYVTSLFLHRSLTHGSIELDPRLKMAARTANWLFTGQKPREWVGVHLAHHANEDKEGDPHSPVMQGKAGVLKVLFGNVPLYRKKAKSLESHEYPASLAPDKWDKRIFDKGLLGQAALFGLFTLANRGNVKKGAAAVAAHRVASTALSLVSNDLQAVGLGGAVNGLGHRGSEPFPKYLYETPKPHEDGTYFTNLPFPRIMGAITVGEAWHREHHLHQGRLTFHPNPLYDPAGALGRGLIKIGLAKPGTGPPRLPEAPQPQQDLPIAA